MIHCGNHPDLPYREGQAEIIHLVADLFQTIEWAESNHKRWAFTRTNTGANIFEDYSDLEYLVDLNWSAIRSFRWSGKGIDPKIKDEKQAEFLLEERFPWHLISQIGVYDQYILETVQKIISENSNKPKIAIKENWYY